MSNKTTTIAVVGGLCLIGIGALCYKAYQKGRAVGYAEGHRVGYQQASQKYEQQIQAINIRHANETRELQAMINQLKQENATLQEKIKSKEK